MTSNPVCGLCGPPGRGALVTLVLAATAILYLAGGTVQSSSPTIVGKGRIVIGKMKNAAGDAENDVGPQGTFFYDDRYSQVRFPLPAAGNGPAPCFCLVGRIGHGPVLYVGAERSWTPEQTGRLWLGIN